MYILNIIKMMFFLTLEILGKTAAMTGIILSQWFFLKDRIIRGKTIKKIISLICFLLLGFILWGILTYWHIAPFVMDPIVENFVFAYLAALIALKIVLKYQRELLTPSEKWMFIVLAWTPPLVLGAYYIFI